MNGWLDSRIASPPTRGRGSKRLSHTRPFFRARRPPRGGADRNSVSHVGRQVLDGRPPRGGADRNTSYPQIGIPMNMSPPTRGRGSKHGEVNTLDIVLRVAPHAGARIETMPARSLTMPRQVAPHAGARIETRQSLQPPLSLGSPPTRGRGSKQSLGGGHGGALKSPWPGGADRSVAPK